MGQNHKLIWAPQPGPQTMLLQCPYGDILYGGSRGAGKSDACLGEWLIHAGRYGSNANGMLFRRHLHELDPIIRRSQELYSDVGRYLKQQKTWEFHNGATITFRHLDSVEDSDLYKGASFTRLYFEELADWPDHAPRMRMNGTLRSAAGVPVKCISTGNPGGPGQGWVKECYIDPAPKGMVPVHDDFRDIAGWERVYVPATSADNQILMKNDPSYLQRLASVGSAALARAWILGDWDSVEGAFFSDYNAGVHVIAPLDPPSDWTRFRALDWGSEAPFCCLWFAVSDGSVADFPREALIVYREWYERGARLSAEQFAQGIIDRTEMPQSYTEADPSIFREDGGPSIAERMADTGIVCCPADNTRIAGWDQVRGRLKGIDGRPMLYISSNCANLIREISTAQHDRNKIEDVDSSGDDHAIDACRYACASRPWITQPRITPPQGLRLEDLIKPRGVANV